MEEYDHVTPTAQLAMSVGDRTFYPELADNPSATALFSRLEKAVLDIHLEDRAGSEKHGRLPWSLPAGTAIFDAIPGDIVLRGEDEISVCYGEGVEGSAKLARIDYVSGEELMEALGDGAVQVSFWLEWSERRPR